MSDENLARAEANAEQATRELEQAREQRDALLVVKSAAGRQAELRTELDVAEADLASAMRAASTAGAPLSAIGEAAGISREWARRRIAAAS